LQETSHSWEREIHCKKNKKNEKETAKERICLTKD
jgi:hypothetical protein